ncbi:sodium:solute symporter [Spiroplasma turonicum]|uniref:sodium:solute symporter n=1 Tax=Spiroplasma turonicum TaxID=216946 RepID=UPI0007430CB2|nr:sodium:solute symporter [Spiroplasma turonicum]ALX70963.1 solute:Na+ symporter, SSS family [Spiroplasma turonicum]
MFNATKINFHIANYIVLALYLAIMMGIGVYFKIKSKIQKTEHNSKEFFRSGGKIPGWIAGFSIYSTTISAITYMSTPAKAFSGDWLWAFGNLTIFIVTPLLIKFIIPFFKRLDATTGYGFLEKRFSYFLRLFSSVMFILFHTLKIGVIIYLPTIALTSVTDINPYAIAAVIGILCMIYTILGGMNGVIWTEFIQAIVLLGGIALAIIFALAKMPDIGGINGSIQDNDKILSLKSALPNGWANDWILILFFGQIINTFYQYVGSQDVIQRYQSNQSFKQTKKGLWTNAILSLITIFLFYGMGSLLFAYYNQKTGLSNSSDIVNDLGITSEQILPYFIVTVLPIGISGLIIAGIYAASMGTISSSLHCSATCIVEDIIKKWKPDLEEKKKLLYAKIIIVIAGIIGTTAALTLIATKAQNMLDLTTNFISLFGVSVSVIYILGIFTKRTSNIGAILAGLFGFIVLFIFFILSIVHNNNPDSVPQISQFYGTLLAFFGSLITGYLSSFIFKNKKIDKLDGLTIHTFSKEEFEEVVKKGEEEWNLIKQNEKEFKKTMINKLYKNNKKNKNKEE